MAKKRKRKEKLDSSGRRGFFRDLLVQALEVGEQVGKNMVDRTRPRYGWLDPDPAPTPAYDYKSAPYSYGYDSGYDNNDTPYGPPWPPAYGPPTPMPLLKQMREWHSTPPIDAVSRGGHEDMQD
ncbi:MAG: hypothetical protein GC159_09750 [Phycisphaera sp.]|nr:hypothetical protein [Phycisphaera sp.]